MKRPSSPARTAVTGLLALAAFAIIPAASAAAATQDSCEGQVAEQPFMPWADPAHYVLVPNGTVEASTRWNLKGGAMRIAGNESFHVHDEDDRSSLALPPGSSATTGWMCVGLEHPTLRLFATNRGSALSQLLVEVLYVDATGRKGALTIGTHQATSSWQPTVPLAVAANTLATTPGEHIDVAFRFTPLDGGDWSIDDVYVDPVRHG